jgi:hypothetical protein
MGPTVQAPTLIMMLRARVAHAPVAPKVACVTVRATVTRAEPGSWGLGG